MVGQSLDAIEALEKILRLLRITRENMSNRSIELAISETKEMLTVPVLAIYNENVQIIIPKSIVPDPGWFDGGRTKFEDWWREI